MRRQPGADAEASLVHGGTRTAGVQRDLGERYVEFDSPFAVVLAASTSGNVWYTLVGAAVAGTATLLAVALKFVLDAKGERERHERELQKLRLQLAEARTDVLSESRKAVFVMLLAETSGVYQEIVRIRRLRRQDSIDDIDYGRLLRAISPVAGQAALEEARLLASDATCARAEALWNHLRGADIAIGVLSASVEWVAWKSEYWCLRRELVAQCKTDLNLEPAAGPTTESGTVDIVVGERSLTPSS